MTAYQCPHCSRSIAGGEAFCPHCGGALAALPPVAKRSRFSGVNGILTIVIVVMALGLLSTVVLYLTNAALVP